MFFSLTASHSQMDVFTAPSYDNVCVNYSALLLSNNNILKYPNAEMAIQGETQTHTAASLFHPGKKGVIKGNYPPDSNIIHIIQHYSW